MAIYCEECSCVLAGVASQEDDAICVDCQEGIDDDMSNDWD